MRHALKAARLQNSVLTYRNSIQRPIREGKQAYLCKAPDQQSLIGRCCSDRVKESALTWGDLGLGSEFLYTKKSAEVILVAETSRDY